jgi:hypothetical protein
VQELRISYQRAIEIMRTTVGCVVLEATAESSPFFPAKLSDCLWVRKPILALSPRQSTTADLLGSDYPLLITPDDVPGITRALNRLWDHWKQERLADLVPAETVVEGISDRAAVRALLDIPNRLLKLPTTVCEQHYESYCQMAETN